MQEDITMIEVRWAVTKYPSAVEEYLLNDYIEKFCKKSKHNKVT